MATLILDDQRFAFATRRMAAIALNPSASASSISSTAVTRFEPRSILETVFWPQPRRSATCCWVSPAFCLRSMRSRRSSSCRGDPNCFQLMSCCRAVHGTAAVFIGGCRITPKEPHQVDFGLKNKVYSFLMSIGRHGSTMETARDVPYAARRCHGGATARICSLAGLLQVHLLQVAMTAGPFMTDHLFLSAATMVKQLGLLFFQVVQ